MDLVPISKLGIFWIMGWRGPFEWSFKACYSRIVDDDVHLGKLTGNFRPVCLACDVETDKPPAD
ncbi:hypothetical protein D3C80_2158710 [compost metagenome]